MRYLLLSALIASTACLAQQHDPAMHRQHMATQPTEQSGDHRQPVVFPEQMKQHTLASMRDHLAALQEIQAALAAAQFDQAADVAERRLGLSSLADHGAHESARFMPPGMQSAGGAMHRAASRFSTVARDAAVSGDIGAAVAALSEVTAACVSCHNGYRLR